MHVVVCAKLDLIENVAEKLFPFVSRRGRFIFNFTRGNNFLFIAIILDFLWRFFNLP